MNSLRTLSAISLMLCAGGVASAGVGPTPDDGSYAPRSTVVRPVLPNDTVSIGLAMLDGALNRVAINNPASGLATPSVMRGSTFTDIGANRNGTGRILASWDEVVSGNDLFIRAVIRTSNNQPFMPASATVNGQPAFFWTWSFGTTDRVSFYDTITEVTVTSARVLFSADGGASFAGGSPIPGLGGAWGGVDQGDLLAVTGDNTNFMLLEYKIVAVPAPGGMLALAGVGLFAARRRR